MKFPSLVSVPKVFCFCPQSLCINTFPLLSLSLSLLLVLFYSLPNKNWYCFYRPLILYTFRFMYNILFLQKKNDATFRYPTETKWLPFFIYSTHYLFSCLCVWVCVCVCVSSSVYSKSPMAIQSSREVVFR